MAVLLSPRRPCYHMLFDVHFSTYISCPFSSLPQLLIWSVICFKWKCENVSPSTNRHPTSGFRWPFILSCVPVALTSPSANGIVHTDNLVRSNYVDYPMHTTIDLTQHLMTQFISISRYATNALRAVRKFGTNPFENRKLKRNAFKSMWQALRSVENYPIGQSSLNLNNHGDGLYCVDL